MFFIFGKPKGIDELKRTYINIKGINRKDVPIAIIDDEPFPYLSVLQNHDFNIKEIGDIKDIKAVEAYSIILCDIKGVGTHFGSKHDGGHIIDEISKYYPTKVKIAYTSQQFDPTYNKFFTMCDFAIKKDTDSDDWVNYLDESIKIIKDPIRQWIKLRESLVRLGIASELLLRLEDEYVKRMLGKQNDFPSSKLMAKLPDDIRAVVAGFIANLIFKYTIG